VLGQDVKLDAAFQYGSTNEDGYSNAGEHIDAALVCLVVPDGNSNGVPMALCQIPGPNVACTKYSQLMITRERL